MTSADAGASLTATDAALLRARRTVNRLLTFIFAGLLLIAIAVVSFRYVETVGEGRREVNNLADLLSEYLVIRLRGIDGALTRVAADNLRLGGPDGQEREWSSAMRAAIAGVPGLSSLVILDAEGVVRHATVQQIIGLSWEDRDVFQKLARGVPNLLFVDAPVTMVAGNQVLVPFGRALTNPRGNFVGAAIALLLPNQLRDFLATFDLGRSGIAWVLLPSGETLFRDGAADNLDGTDTVESPLFAVDGPATGDGFVRGPLSPNGADYLTAYRKTAIGDLIVAVSIADRSFLQRWWYEAIGILVFVTIVGVLLYFAARRINSVMLDIVTAVDGVPASQKNTDTQTT